MLLVRATTKAGDPLLLIGLSAANRTRLADGQPIDITTRQLLDSGVLSAPLHIVLFAGETEDAMHSQLSQLITPETTVVDRRQGVS